VVTGFPWWRIFVEGSAASRSFCPDKKMAAAEGGDASAGKITVLEEAEPTVFLPSSSQ
jgi:hypothetical protein